MRGTWVVVYEGEAGREVSKNSVYQQKSNDKHEPDFVTHQSSTKIACFIQESF